MVARRPLVEVNGEIHQLPVGDTIVGAPGGSASVTEVLLDFGSTARGSKTFTVTVAGVTVGQKIVAAPSAKTTASVPADELEVEPIFAFAHVSATDEVKITCGPVNPIAFISGERYVNLIIG